MYNFIDTLFIYLFIKQTKQYRQIKKLFKYFYCLNLKYLSFKLKF